MTTPKPALLPALLFATLACVAGIPDALAQPAPPGAPTNLQAAVNGNTISLTWNAPSSGGAPTGYTLLARITAGGPLLATVPVGNVTSFATAGPNGVFVLSLVATNATGAGPESSTIGVTLPTMPAPPGAPSSLVAAAFGDTATFTWAPPFSGGAVANYVLFAGLTPGFAAPIATLPVPASQASVVVPGVPAGTYYVRVVAQNAGGTSAPTNEATMTIAGPLAPGAPTLSQPTGAGNTLNLAWAAGGGGLPTSYLLTALTTGGAVVATVPLSGTAISFANVPNGTYVLRLVAVNAVGASAPSNQVTVTLPITGPPPPPPPIAPRERHPQLGRQLRQQAGALGHRPSRRRHRIRHRQRHDARLRAHRRHLDANRRQHHRRSGGRPGRQQRRLECRRHPRRHRRVSERRRRHQFRPRARLRPGGQLVDAGWRGPRRRRRELGAGVERGLVGQRRPSHRRRAGQRHHDRSNQGLRTDQRHVDPARDDADGRRSVRRCGGHLGRRHDDRRQFTVGRRTVARRHRAGPPPERRSLDAGREHAAGRTDR